MEGIVSEILGFTEKERSPSDKDESVAVKIEHKDNKGLGFPRSVVMLRFRHVRQHDVNACSKYARAFP